MQHCGECLSGAQKDDAKWQINLILSLTYGYFAFTFVNNCIKSNSSSQILKVFISPVCISSLAHPAQPAFSAAGPRIKNEFPNWC